jgi:CRP/FNR family cyclic AMP-dependent transcriptional regulator
MRKALLFLGILDDADISWLVKVGSRRQLFRNDVLIREGTVPESIFLVIEGRFSVTMSSLNGREIASLSAGEVIGEMSFVDSRPPSASVLACEPSRVLAVPRHLLVERLAESPPFAARFYRALAAFLADRLRNTVATLGYNAGDELNANKVYRDEIDPALLDSISLAGARFQWILNQLGA